MTLENFIAAHPHVTLSHTNYGQHFYLGGDVSILSAPAQCLQAFVEEEGTPYRFLVVGRLASFRVVQDCVRQGPIILTLSIWSHATLVCTVY